MTFGYRAEPGNAGEDLRYSARLVRLLDVIGQGSSPDALLRDSLDALAEVFAADVAVLTRTAGAEVEILAVSGGGRGPTTLPISVLESLADAAHEPRRWVGVDARDVRVISGLTIRAAVYMPIANERSGADGLILLRSHAVPFDEHDLPGLRMIGARLVASLADAQRRVAVERLAVAGHRLGTHLQPQALLEDAVQVLHEITGGEATMAVRVFGDLADIVAYRTDVGRSEDDAWPRPVTSLAAWPAAQQRRPHLVEDLATGPAALEPRMRGRARSMMSVPIVVDGRPEYLLYALHSSPAFFSSGAVDTAMLLAGYVAAAMENIRLYGARVDSEVRLRMLTDAISDMVIVVCPSGEILWASPSCARGIGYDVGELVGRPLAELVHPDDSDMLALATSGSVQTSSVEHRLRHSLGGWRWVETKIAVAPGESANVVLSSRLTGERRRLEAELRHRATHDPLTGLANRDLVRQALTDELAADGPGGVGLLFCDLDEFKAVNDRLGHEAGDELLRLVSDRLVGCTRAGDLLARLGGDEFVVIMPGAETLAEVTALGQRIVEVLHPPFDVGPETVRIGVSVGGVLGERGPDPQAATDLLRDADAAMYEAKRVGRGRVQVFDGAAAHEAMERLALQQDIQHALARKQFSVLYQPIVDLSTGRPLGFEALLRWNRDHGAPVPPDVFIPMAEATGAITAIGAWVLGEACQRLAQWRRLPGGAHLSMSVNVSPVQLDDPRLVDLTLSTIAAAGLEPGDLRLEITEGTPLSPARLALLRRLDAAGVALAVDDFGVSYSNLAYLKDLPISTIKIDKTFVTGLCHEGSESSALAARRQAVDLGIVSAVLALAEAAGLSVIAEGVETAAQRDCLLSLGCVNAQGYLFSHPLPSGRIPGLIVESSRHRDGLVGNARRG